MHTPAYMVLYHIVNLYKQTWEQIEMDIKKIDRERELDRKWIEA